MDQFTINYNLQGNQILLKVEGSIDKHQLSFFSNIIVEMTIEQAAQCIHLDFSQAAINMDLIDVYRIVEIFEELSLSKNTKILITPAKKRVPEDFFRFYEQVLRNHGYEVLVAQTSI